MEYLPSCSDAIMNEFQKWNPTGKQTVPTPRYVLDFLNQIYSGQVDPEIEKLKKAGEILELSAENPYFFLPETKTESGFRTIFDAAKALLNITSYYRIGENGPTREEAVRILTGVFGIPENQIYPAAEMLNGDKIMVEPFIDETGKEDVKFIKLSNYQKKRLKLKLPI